MRLCVCHILPHTLCFKRDLLTIEPIAEPGLLNELSRRVEAAEREFVAQDLDQKLRDLEAAKQRQVTTNWGLSIMDTI